MSIKSFFKLCFGVIAVIALLGALLVYLNYSMSNVSSTSAKLLSDTYTVGTDYSGTIDRQYVTQGQSVKKGDKLFDIKSTVAENAEESAARQQAGSPAGTTPQIPDDSGIITLRATGDGTMLNLNYLEGSFVPANKEIATITKAGSLYVEAVYKLAPPDYARVKKGSVVTVTLPNAQNVNATVYDVQIINEKEQVQTIIKARVTDQASSSAFNSGTPVTTVLRLSDKTLYSSLQEALNNVIQPKG